MSILTQAGVIALIIMIVFILIRSNKRLIEAAEEGEHFVDEWALREERKQKLINRPLQEGDMDQSQVSRMSREMDLDEWETDRQFREAGRSQSQMSRMSREMDLDQWEVSGTLQEGDLDQGGTGSTARNQSQTGRSPQDTARDQWGTSMSSGETDQLLQEISLSFIELDEKGKAVNRISVCHLPFTIGRAPDNDLVIDDLCVARQHCRIVRRNRAIIMEDGGSRNKLAVGGRLQAETVLKDRMIIGIGNRDFMVEMRGSNG